MIYGDFDLRRGDSDDAQIWGGRRSPPGVATAAAGALTTLRPVSAVADLQRDLRKLGFLLAPTPISR